MIHTNRPAGTFRKSSFSGVASACVELAPLAGGGVAVRDSKHRGAGPVLQFTPAEWAAFDAAMHAGEFDYLLVWPVGPGVVGAAHPIAASTTPVGWRT